MSTELHPTHDAYVVAIQENIADTRRLFESGDPPAVIATVSGSSAAQAFWQHQLEAVGSDLGAKSALSLHEDLPVNQAFGVLLLWQRLREHRVKGKGALAAFVFGEGSRATPLTETDNGQKPAIKSFVSVPTAGGARRYLSMVELAMRYFAPVESHLRRSGFDGLVIKWGDEVQIPSTPLSGTDPRFETADVVRFVSLRAMTDDDARNKDWLGVDATGRVTEFIPRRPLSEMEALAQRGALQRRGAELWGGVNMGSIAISSALLECLLEEFSEDLADATADRSQRPDLDPQMFTALTVAAIADQSEREQAWQRALGEVKSLRQIQTHMPDLVARLRRTLDQFEARHGRRISIQALDFGTPYWGDVGQHRQIYEFYMALNAEGPDGRIARALAGLDVQRDGRGNLIGGEVYVSPDVHVENSVLFDCQLRGRGRVKNSVLIGTEVADIHADEAFDVQSTCLRLELTPRSGSYQVVAAETLAAPGERVTTLFLPEGPYPFRVLEQTDLRDRAVTYDVPILGNARSFAEAHSIMSSLPPSEVLARREAAREDLRRRLPSQV